MKTKVLFILGSPRDVEFTEPAIQLFEKNKIPFELKIFSAHRHLEELIDYLKKIEGIEVIIAVAGLSAALPGIISSLTKIPVIGVPRDVGPLNGVDALLSMVQMPRGVPVGTMGIGKTGVINASLFAMRILSLKDKGIKEYLEYYEASLRRESKETL